MNDEKIELRHIGRVESELNSLQDAPRQGDEGAPDAWLQIEAPFTVALRGIRVGDELLVLTWLHLADREVLETHPRNDPSNPLTGVFATRSPDRPNPLGLHRVTVREVHPGRIRVGPIEALNATPVVDIKVALNDSER
jgi:tRNA-Thr(GGU) m(6)t(6)A37 methyltransferase TsaA